jgi:ATP-binding cassette subfamily F protein 3
VSHDRALLRTVCDGFLLVADGRATQFDGDVEDYLEWMAARRARDSGQPDSTADADRDARRMKREAAAAARQEKLVRRRPLLKESNELEKRIEALEGEKSLLEQRLGDLSFYSGPVAEVQATTRRCAELARLIEAAEERWLCVQTELEAIGEA